MRTIHCRLYELYERLVFIRIARNISIAAFDRNQQTSGNRQCCPQGYAKWPWVASRVQFPPVSPMQNAIFSLKYRKKLFENYGVLELIFRPKSDPFSRQQWSLDKPQRMGSFICVATFLDLQALTFLYGIGSVDRENEHTCASHRIQVPSGPARFPFSSAYAVTSGFFLRSSRLNHSIHVCFFYNPRYWC